MLIAETMAQNNCIVNGQCQLQHHSDRIGNKGDLTAEKVSTHIQNGSNAKSSNEDRNFGIRSRGKRKDNHNNDGGNDDNDLHFTLQGGCFIFPDFCVDITVVTGQNFIDPVHGIYTDLISGSPIKGNVKKSGRILIMITGMIKSNFGYAINFQHIIH